MSYLSSGQEYFPITSLAESEWLFNIEQSMLVKEEKLLGLELVNLPLTGVSEGFCVYKNDLYAITDE